ncbi:uncharacterized protein LOC126156726 [Schistocerca cancellata]|uniref:uncharacterized protein LOC126156726 n=1 Tax=Schistocerca cancellata TaxID=274614 RepID=UPI0021196ACA|nr:uncharacterized protein LOC126156726 [Schistocerca cancellata]
MVKVTVIEVKPCSPEESPPCAEAEGRRASGGPALARRHSRRLASTRGLSSNSDYLSKRRQHGAQPEDSVRHKIHFFEQEARAGRPCVDSEEESGSGTLQAVADSTRPATDAPSDRRQQQQQQQQAEAGPRGRTTVDVHVDVRVCSTDARRVSPDGTESCREQNEPQPPSNSSQPVSGTDAEERRQRGRQRSGVSVGDGCGWVRVFVGDDDRGSLVYLSLTTTAADVAQELGLDDDHTIWLQSTVLDASAESRAAFGRGCLLLLAPRAESTCRAVAASGILRTPGAPRRACRDTRGDRARPQGSAREQSATPTQFHTVAQQTRL